MSRKLFVDAKIDNHNLFSYENPREAFGEIFNFFDEKEVNAFFDLYNNGIIDENLDKEFKGNYIYRTAADIINLDSFKKIKEREDEKFSQNLFVNSLKKIASNTIMSQGSLFSCVTPPSLALKDAYEALDKERQPKEKKGAIDASKLVSGNLNISQSKTTKDPDLEIDSDKVNKGTPGDDAR